MLKKYLNNVLALIACVLPLVAAEPETKSPRDLYNQGTQKFKEGKLRDAETFLQTAIAGNREFVQQHALYNLGHVRFEQGKQLLKEAPEPQALKPSADTGSMLTDKAIDQAKKALADNQLAGLVAAYMNGRGVNKLTKNILAAIQHAMESYGAVLLRWERASGDFKSAYELRSNDAQAKENGDIVDQHLARLVDQLQMMQAMAMAGKQKRKELLKLLGDIKDRLPKGMVPGGDEEDEEEPKPKEPPKGKEEPKPKEGKERMMSWEEAMRLLESLKLDTRHILPMAAEKSGNPIDKKLRDW